MGLYLLGTCSGGEANLMTLNWAMQVSTAPKQVAVSVEQSAVTHRLVGEGRCFALSILGREQRAVVRKFVKPAAYDPRARTLNGFAYATRVTGAPIASVAEAFLDCEVRSSLDAGSHTLFVGEVVDAGFGPTGGPGGDTGSVFAEETLAFEPLRMEDTRMSYGG